MRKTQGGKQPISQHPLFPAIVALWCGALAGLCSIALKPAIIEQLIVTARIDSVLPMAAPPLGATFRVLFALAMTGFGGLVGALLARGIARPQPQKRARRRKVEDIAGAEPVAQAAQREAQEIETRAPARPGGRRALANMELEAAGAQEAETARSDTPEQDDRVADDVMADDVMIAPAALETADTERAEPAPSPAPAPAAAGILDVRQFDIDSFDEADATFAASRAPAPENAQIFRLPADEASEDAHETVAEVNPTPIGQGLFDAYSQAIAARTRSASATAPSIFSAEKGPASAEPTPGFALIGPGSAPTPLEHASNDAGEAAPPRNVETAVTRTAERAQAPICDADETQEPDVLRLAGSRTASAAERIAQSELDELSHLELLERLALAMSQRREENRRTAEVAASAQALAPEIPDEIRAYAAADAPPPFSAPFAAPEAANSEPAVAEPLRDPEGEHEAAALAPGPFARPTAEAPARDDEDLNTQDRAANEVAAEPAPDGTHDENEPAPFARPVPTAVPAAMRPVDLDAYDEDEDTLPGYIPPRHIGQSAAPSAPFARPADVAAQDAASDVEEEQVLEEGYSSLLNLSRAAPERQEFVRIDEPETGGEIEPVVIFPGEEAQRAPSFVQRLETVREIEPARGERPFDNPHAQSADESEKALRSALATLQRMSGAA